MPQQFEEVGGAFDCHHCYHTVNTARYFYDKKVIMWKCENPECGKLSWIEGFEL